MSKARMEAVQEVKAWLSRNSELQVIEESHTSDFDEYFIKDDDVTLQVYISDFVQVVNENIHGKK